MRPGKQLFPLNYNNIINDKNIKNNIKAIKLIIRETYGGKRTYINQIMFYEQTAEQVKDLICGNELSKIYKKQKSIETANLKISMNKKNNQKNKQNLNYNIYNKEMNVTPLIQYINLQENNSMQNKNINSNIFKLNRVNANNKLTRSESFSILESHKKRNLGKVFEIILDRREKVYILYYRHNSLLLYYQINDTLYFELDKDYFLILGDIFLSVTVRKTMNTNEKRINFRVEVENEKPKKYSYEQKDVPIKIGRANCHINIPNPSISKLHSIIDFANDMFYYSDKKSTNGSTLLLKEDDILKIKGEMNFKLEDIPFKIKEIIIDEK